MSPAWLLLLSLPSYAAETFDGYDFFLGDVHAHTGASGDGASSDLGDCTGDCGALADVAETARANGLDFLTVTDHANDGVSASAEDFSHVMSVLDAANQPETGLVTIPGAELFFTLEDGPKLGHKSLLLFGSSEELADLDISKVRFREGTSTEVRDCEEIDDFMTALRAEVGDALLLPHHPALSKPMPTKWDCHSEDWGPAVEVYSEHGNSMGWAQSFDPPWSGEEPTGTVAFALDPAGEALRLGFVAGSDNHDTHPGDVCSLDSIRTDQLYSQGLTVVVQPEGRAFDRDAVHAAISHRATYATTGPFVPVLVRYIAGAQHAGMGEEIALAPGDALDVEVRVPPELGSFVSAVWLQSPELPIALESQGGGVWTTTLAPGESPAFVFPDVVIDGGLWWGDDGCEDGGAGDEEHIWLSPTWLSERSGTVDEDDADGDGFPADRDCDDSDPNVYPGADEICTGGVDDDCDGDVDADDAECEGGGGDDSGEPTDGGGGSGVVSGDPAAPPPPARDSVAPMMRCSSVGAGSTMVLWALGALGLAARRRR